MIMESLQGELLGVLRVGYRSVSPFHHKPSDLVEAHAADPYFADEGETAEHRQEKKTAEQ
ncbi:hypothetical protein ABBQ32_005389 [Trebouxia sp. C0010 RCD-2024]